MNILLCTLGQSWAVIPEVFAVLDPERCPLYRNHAQRAAIDSLRAQYKLEPVEELWVCTTDDPALDGGLDRLCRWRELVQPDLMLRIWRAAEVADIADQAAGDRVRELIYRAVLRASEQAGDGKLYLSLAGGRKTMSADLQRAGMVIGCHALLHVIAPPVGRMSERMRTAAPQTFAIPLDPGDCDGLLPLVVGRGWRSELLDIKADGEPPVQAAIYPLPDAADGIPVHFAGDGRFLPAEIERREREGGRLLGNFLQALVESEHHENWRTLYRLPPETIRRLRKTRLGDAHRDWLQALPKADLHRHIGGCLDIAAQRRVGQAIWEALGPAERAAALEQVAPLLRQPEWDWEWPGLLKRGERSHCAAALLVEADDNQLERNLYGVTEPRHGLQHRQPHGFAYYDRPGELTGSAVLTHPAALEPYLRQLLDAARAEGLRYLELRGSPHKYRNGIEAQLHFLRRVRDLAREFEQDLALRFVVIADRTRPDRIEEAVKLAVSAKEQLDGFVVGLDLAGDENRDATDAPDQVAAAFEPAFRACLPITIHAGEGTPADKVWEAAYRLHADRVGHGLTLGEKPELLQRFRDRGICVELCPTSNDEVVGYQGRDYPLQAYWQQGVPLSLCTDNPGISRTDAVDELLKAAEYWPDLSLWDALAIIKQGFVHAFLPATARETLLKQAEDAIYRHIVSA